MCILTIVYFIVVQSLDVHDDRNAFRDRGAEDIDIFRGATAGERCCGEEAECFFVQGDDERYFLFAERHPPCFVSVAVVGVEDLFQGFELERLAFWTAKPSDALVDS